MTDTAETPPKAPPPPADLKRIGRKDGPGRALWKQIAGSGSGPVKYVLRPDELHILAEACREADLIAAIDEEFRNDTRGFIVRGSMGQPAANPLISELRQHRQCYANLLSKIKLPDDDGVGAENPRSTNARNAAQSRWGKTG